MKLSLLVLLVVLVASSQAGKKMKKCKADLKALQVENNALQADVEALEAEVETLKQQIKDLEESMPKVNLALNRPAYQKDDGVWGGVAGRAVDGNTNGIYAQHSCTHTHSSAQPWWAVDLGKVTDIGSVIISNRVGSSDRLANFQIGTTNTDPRQTAPRLGGYTVCVNQGPALAAAETKEIACQATGRYLIVQLKGSNYLTLCEVQVYGR